VDVRFSTAKHTATHCNTLQHTATNLQYSAILCNTLQHTQWTWNSAQSNTMQLNATHCNKLQYSATHAVDVEFSGKQFLITTPSGYTRTSDITDAEDVSYVCVCVCSMQRTATRCNTLQHFTAHQHPTLKMCPTFALWASLHHAATRCNALQ